MPAGSRRWMHQRLLPQLILVLLMQGFQIRYNITQLGLVQTNNRHVHARLHRLRICYPSRKRSRSIIDQARGYGQSSGDVRQIGAHAPECAAPAYGMACAARTSEDTLTCGRSGVDWWRCCLFALRCSPRLILDRRLCYDSEGHVRMLQPAVFRALAAIHSRAICPDPRLVSLTRDDIDLATQFGHPERVDYICRPNPEKNWHANRQVNLVRSSEGMGR